MRISKSKKYAIEQFLIQKELISLLNLEGGFYLYDLDRDPTKQQTIMDMVPDVWRYFAHMNVTGLLYPEKCKRPWLSIVRGVLKNRYQLKYKACRYLSRDGSVFTMKYYIEPLKTLSQMKKSGSTDSLSYDTYSECDTSDSDSISSQGSSDSPKKKIKLQLRCRKKYSNIDHNKTKNGKTMDMIPNNCSQSFQQSTHQQLDRSMPTAAT